MTGIVAVEATPPEAGERDTAILVFTDSPATPVVALQLRLQGRSRVEGERSASRLDRVGGDLAYVGNWSPKEVRTVTAVTFEPPGEDHPPAIETSLPFLGVELIDVTRRSTTAPGVVSKIYTYEVSFLSDPPPGRFDGEVLVTDYWDASRHDRVRVFGETPEAIRAIPSRLILRDHPPGAAAEATLKVILRDPELVPILEPQGVAKDLLSIRQGPSTAPGTFVYRIGIDDRLEVADDRIDPILIRTSPSRSEPIAVPVMIRREGRP